MKRIWGNYVRLSAYLWSTNSLTIMILNVKSRHFPFIVVFRVFSNNWRCAWFTKMSGCGLFVLSRPIYPYPIISLPCLAYRCFTFGGSKLIGLHHAKRSLMAWVDLLKCLDVACLFCLGLPTRTQSFPCLAFAYRICFTFGGSKLIGLRHAKRSPMTRVVVISKEGWAHMAMPILLLVWHRLFKKKKI